MSIVTYCDLVDANALSFLWPKEFQSYYICFISGNPSSPIITTFRSNKDDGSNHPKKEIIIHCDGNHFTLLRPKTMHPHQRGFQV
jgi:hypothetical protein